MPLVQNASTPAQEPTAEARLDAPDPDERRRAANHLSRPKDVPQLAQALGTETERSVQSALLDALCDIGNSEAADAIIPFLRAEDTGLRNGAVAALRSFEKRFVSN